MSRKNWSKYKSLERKRNERFNPTQDQNKSKVERLERRNSQRNSTQAERFIQARLERFKKKGA